MKEISINDVVYARLVSVGDWKSGLNFFSKDSESIQVGAWHYDAGTELKRHIHNEVPRQIARTQEVLIIQKGSVEAIIYDLEEHEIGKLVATAGDILILLDSGHGYRILENNTMVIEVKNGPYPGAEVDRHRF